MEEDMGSALTEAVLVCENDQFQGSGGRSQENRACGFRPAFIDMHTGAIYASCFADGRPAPVHVLDGLPDEIVHLRHPSGRVASVKASVVSGFVLDGQFFSRDEAAMMMAHRFAA
jgi:hypothetical protein